ncbi:hypothetical protein BGW80DRAFT_1393803 [Lactifluus volemus]|nr:hypothetical protein BGW80DRAFT_1393803 [Lactifluus volemus]
MPILILLSSSLFPLPFLPFHKLRVCCDVFFVSIKEPQFPYTLAIDLSTVASRRTFVSPFVHSVSCHTFASLSPLYLLLSSCLTASHLVRSPHLRVIFFFLLSVRQSLSLVLLSLVSALNYGVLSFAPWLGFSIEKSLYILP